jgi:hypothetical protein
MDQKPPSVEEVVLQVIGDIVGKKCNFTLYSKVVSDLNISSDDLSMYFVPELERRLGVRVPLHEWRTVETGNDVCTLLRKYSPKVDGTCGTEPSKNEP